MGLLCTRNRSMASEDTAVGVPMEDNICTCDARLRIVALIGQVLSPEENCRLLTVASVRRGVRAARDGFRPRLGKSPAALPVSGRGR